MKIVTSGSIWTFRGTEDGGLYCRFPRQEGPRRDEYGIAHPEWGSKPGAGQDAVWHPYTRWLFVRDSGDAVRLVIEYPDTECSAEDQHLKCTQRHYIRTGVVVEPVIDSASVELSWIDHEADYRARRLDNPTGV